MSLIEEIKRIEDEEERPIRSKKESRIWMKLWTGREKVKKTGKTESWTGIQFGGDL